MFPAQKILDALIAWIKLYIHFDVFIHVMYPEKWNILKITKFYKQWNRPIQI